MSKGQQEMVGFVLIVVLVVVGLMVFLTISLKSGPKNEADVEAENMLAAVVGATSDCVFSLKPEDYGDVFKACKDGRSCKTPSKPACKYLNESLPKVFDSLVETDAKISGYVFDAAVERPSSRQSLGISKIEKGKCFGKSRSAVNVIITGSDKIILRLKLCRA